MGRYPAGEGWEMEESKEKENSLREEKYVLEGKTQAGGLKKGETTPLERGICSHT